MFSIKKFDPFYKAVAKRIFVFIPFILFSISIKAQEKKVISFDEMLSWRSIDKSAITNDGNFVVYEMAPLKGNSVVIIHNTKANTNDTLIRAKNFSLSPDGSFIIAVKTPPYEVLRQAKIDKLDKDKTPKDSTIIYNFITKKIITLPVADSILVSKTLGSIGGVLLKKDNLKKSENDTSSIKKVIGRTLVIYSGVTKDTASFNSVTEFSISEKGDQLAFIEGYKDSVSTCSVCRILDSGKKTTTEVFSSTGDAKKLCFDAEGEQLAFLYTKDTTKIKNYCIYFSFDKNYSEEIISKETNGMLDDWGVNEHGKLFFSENKEMLFFQTSPIKKEKTDTIPTDEIPILDVWSWTDKKLQTQQNLEVKTEKNRGYTAVWHIKKKEMVQLANKQYALVSLTTKRNADYALLADEEPYLRESNWTGLWKRDLAVVNVNTGEITEITKAQNSYQISRAGKYVVWYEISDTCYYSYSIEKGTIVNLTKNLGVNIYNELEDLPRVPLSYGIGGWAPGDKNIIIYDRYDIWKIDPEGLKPPENITNYYGRNNHITLRIIDLDKENEFVPLNQELLLSGVNEINNKSYFFSYYPGKSKEPKIIQSGEFKYSRPQKAFNANVLLWTKQSYQVYPDLIVSDIKFKASTTISNINPQQSDYLWGTCEPYQWTSFRGETLNGLLYKPENFDSTRSYPMIVYFYERNFFNQYDHFIPTPSRSIINKTFYTSNDYIVFVPDITYIDGYPGQSAYDCIVSGTTSLIEHYSWVDKKHIGIQGQSWGGYQVAYLVTQTDLFAAGMGGAVVSNMTSAYGGIRWESGKNRMFQYEKEQSRIGGSLWEKPMQYIENSPLFFVPKVNTPLLLMHNDEDGAVPWYQGIEYFVALRRLNKPVWMLSYNGQPHNLARESIANRLDLSIRMKQFFDHYLKDKPMPAWMQEGIPAVDKGENLGYSYE